MKKFEKILILVILLISVVSMGIIKFKSSSEKSNIVIQVDNKVEKKIPFNRLENKTYDFTFNNHIGTIEVKDGKVRMLEMSKDICPNAICSDTGWIETTFQSIVCLPNKIVVKIEGVTDNQKNNQVDIII
jgi:hypothetical protein